MATAMYSTLSEALILFIDFTFIKKLHFLKLNLYPLKARIVAMTFTHAALIRKKLIELGFTYHSVIIEEAAQVLEIETVIPLLMQVVLLIFLFYFNKS
jgi:superfamily I DNA and/or RNA helicase